MSDYQILRLPQVMKRTGLGRASIYNLRDTGEFPKPIALTKRAVGWLEAEIDAWLENLADTQRVGK